MPDYRLRIGMRFKRQGREHVIEKRLAPGILKVRDTERDVYVDQSVKGLITDLFAGEVELIGEDNCRSNLEDKISKSRVTDISQLKDDNPLKLAIERRLHYVQEVIKSQPCAKTKQNLTLIIESVVRKINDPDPPSWVTVNRWFRTFEEAGRDVRALAPSLKARGNTEQRISGKVPTALTDEDYEKARVVYAIVDRVIRTKYLTRERPTVLSVHESIVDRIIEENRYRESHDQLPIPHLSSLYKIIKKLDKYEVDRKRYGKKYADEKHRANKQCPRPSRPLERVECDHTKIDMMVIDDKSRLPLGRPWLTVLIDVYTKMILGIYLSFHRPGAVSVLQCLIHAVRPKSYLKTVYPVVKNDWPTYGIPEEIWVDNAREFYSSHFKDACLQIGIEIQHSPIGRAWFRATVERWFGTLNKRLLHELPGTTFSNIFHKRDYDPRKHAVISLEALLEIIHVWIVDYYHKRFHRGIQDVPYRRWTEGIVDSPPNLPASSTDLEILMGFIAYRSVSRSGIELFALLYNSSELSLIRRRLDEGEKVMIKYDPTDISMIYVWDKRHDKFAVVPALDQEYTRKLTVWQHHVIRRYARLFVKEHVDLAALCQAKETIKKIIERERALTKRIGGQQKIAHYLNIGQPNYERADETSSSGNGKLITHQASVDLTSPLLSEGQALVSGSDTQETLISAEDFDEQSQAHKTVSPVEGQSYQEKEPDEPEEDGWGADYDLPRGR